MANKDLPRLVHGPDITATFLKEFENDFGLVRSWQIAFQGKTFFVSQLLPKRAPKKAEWLAGPMFSSDRKPMLLWSFDADPHVYHVGKGTVNVFFGIVGKGTSGLIYRHRFTDKVVYKKPLRLILPI